MGADLILFSIVTPKDKKPNYEKARKFIDSLTSKSVNEQGDALVTVDFDQRLDPPNDDKLDVVAIQERARKLLREVEEAFDGGRDCTTVETTTETVWITGGMSAGDDPSRTFRILCDLDVLGVVEHLSYAKPLKKT